ncbi:MAG: hypothetical protein NUK54_11205, partial [Methanothrix sp.]|nr:hypothetical protein [Methanothrix sp.]
GGDGDAPADALARLAALLGAGTGGRADDAREVLLIEDSGSLPQLADPVVQTRDPNPLLPLKII